MSQEQPRLETVQALRKHFRAVGNTPAALAFEITLRDAINGDNEAMGYVILCCLSHDAGREQVAPFYARSGVN